MIDPTLARALAEANLPTDTLLLTISEAARALRISERTLWDISQPRGPIAVITLGRRKLYSRGWLVSWIADSAARSMEGTR